MPMVAESAATLMTASILEEIKKVLPDAQATPFQQSLCKAVAGGVIKVMKSQAKGIGAAGPPAAGPGTGITGIDADRMTKYGMKKFQEKVGSTGQATEPMLTAVFKGLAKVMSQATVSSVSGFGGPVLSVVNLIDSQVSDAIFKEFPQDTQDGMSKSKFGKSLLDAIAYGFVQEMSTVAKATIPVGSGSPGPVVASFS